MTLHHVKNQNFHILPIIVMIVPVAKGGLKQLMNVIYQYIYIILVNYFWHMCSCTVVAHIALVAVLPCF